MNIKKLPIHSYSNGDELFINIYEFDSGKPGPHIYVQANVHGSEIQGNAVIFELIKYLKENDFVGKWVLVPQANPLASNSKSIHFTNGRISQLTGENFNRTYTDLSKNIPFENFKDLSEEELSENFKKYLINKLDKKYEAKKEYGLSYAENLSYTLQRMAMEADIVLDLHNDTRSKNYIYAANYLMDRVQFLDFEMAIMIPHIFAGAMDEAFFMPWITLYTEMGKECPKLSLTLELGDEESFCVKRAKDQMNKILSFIEKEKKSSIEQYPLSSLKSYRVSRGCLVDYFKEAGDFVQAGDLLCKLFIQGEEVGEILAKKNGRILNRCPSSNTVQGMRVYQILES